MSWAQEVARERLAGVLPQRWVHVQGVAQRAGEAAPLFGEDADLLVAAAFLHDVGYAPDLAESGFHPLDGARYLRRIGVPQRLVNLVAHHSCAYQEAELRGLSAELAEFAEERTLLGCALVGGHDYRPGWAADDGVRADRGDPSPVWP